MIISEYYNSLFYIHLGLNTNEKTVKLNTNENLRYDDLYIATGSKPKLPDLPGVELSNIFLLRTYTDSAAIAAQLSPEKHIVILGFGFIGMEAAAYCVGKCASVTVVGRSSVPFKELFGEEIGERIKREFVGKGKPLKSHLNNKYCQDYMRCFSFIFKA